MFRVARSGSRIFIFDINDAAKVETYHRVRGAGSSTRELVKKTDFKTTHLFFTKQWFRDLGEDFGAKVTIWDEADLAVSFHSGSEYRFAVCFNH